MKKISILALTLLLCGTMAGCGSSDDKQGNTSHRSTQNSNSSNNSNNNNNNPQQQTPGAGGFDTSGIGEMLKKANAVQGEPSSVDLSEIGAEEATQYGNTVIVKFNLSSQGYFDAYDNGKVSVNGKTWYVYGVAGPYMLFFTDDNPNQDAIGVFEQLAGGRTYPVKK